MTAGQASPSPPGCPATCERFPEACSGCSMDCYAAGEWSMDPFDDEPEIRVGYGCDWERWWEVGI